MKLTLIRFLKNCGAALILLMAFFFCAWFFAPQTAQAETYSVGENVITVTLDYGAAPRYPVLTHQDSGKHFKIVSYLAEDKNGATFSLVEGGAVTAVPATYRLPASTNTVYCDGEGNALSGDDFSGTIRVVVQKNLLPITVSAASLTKTYGETVTALTWDFKEEADRDNTISLSFACAGFAAAAHVGAYDVSVASVTKGTENVSAFYDVRLYPEEGADPVRFAVTPRAVDINLATQATVPFNHYVGADGTSVCSSSVSGVNGEAVTAYYRLSSPPEGVLTVGEEYEVEAYRYEVSSSSGVASYALTDPSDYAPSFLYDQNTVVAGKGTLTIYQDQSLVEAREGDNAYLYYPFSYPYLDLLVKNHVGNTWIPVPFFGLNVSLYCEVDAPNGVMAVGDYPLTLLAYDCASFDSVVFEGEVVLSVVKRILTYSGADSAEIMMGSTFVKRVSLPFEDHDYLFDLTADVSGRAVGEEVPYLSATAVTDANFDLDLSGATVTLTKRSTGVSLVADDRVSVSYGEEYELAALYLDRGSPSEQKLQIPVIYEYKPAGSSARKDGLPVEVGNYVVYCSVESDLYEAAEKTVELTVAKRPVAGYYHITSAKKVYGNTFDFSRNVQLICLYDYDEVARTADRAAPITLTDGMVGGVLLTCSAGGASQRAGTYDFDFSGADAQHYRIVAAIVYDITAEEEVSEFTVVKASAPAAPVVNVEVTGRDMKILSTGPIRAELSLKADHSSAKAQTSATGTVTFTGLTCGALYYVRVRAEDNTNYKSPSAWTEGTQAVPFARPEVTLEEVLSGTARIAAATTHATEDYTVQYRIGATGTWMDGSEIKQLKPDTQYVVYFRLKNEFTTGESSSLSFHTLCAPVGKDELSIDFDRMSGVLSITSAVDRLEYRLYSASGELLTDDWTELSEFMDLQKDTTYLLQVRRSDKNGETASEITEITIDTRLKGKFSLRRFLCNNFLFFIGGGLVIAIAIAAILFAEAKRRAESEELGRKEE